VIHTTLQVQRFILRARHRIKQQIMREQSMVSDTASIASSRISTLTDRKIRVVFRRYYVNDVSEIQRHDNRAKLIMEEINYKKSMEASLLANVSDKLESASKSPGEAKKSSDSLAAETAAVSDPVVDAPSAPELQNPAAEADEDSNQDDPDVEKSVSNGEKKSEADTATSAVAISVSASPEFSVPPTPPAPRPVLLSAEEEQWDHEAARIDLVCRTCTSKEVYKGMSDLQREVQTM
jgi:hypothetical protein